MVSEKNPEIFLIGDLASHVMLARDPGKNDEEPPHHPHVRRQHLPLLPAMISAALQDGQNQFDGKKQIVYCLPKEKHGIDGSPDVCGERISILELFPRGSQNRAEAKVLRVKQDYLASASSSDDSLDSRYFLESIKATEGRDGEKYNHRITVIYDQNGYTRQAISKLSGDAIRIFREALGTDDLIIAISGDIFQWIRPLKKITDEILTAKPNNITIQLTADTLRKAGVNITKYGALEDSIRDIIDSLGQPPLSDLLKSADNLIIIFRETGSFHIRKSKERLTASLHFCPNFDRIAQSDPAGYGEVPGKFAIFLTALIKGLYLSAKNGQEPNYAGALRLGAVAFNYHFSHGLRPADPFASIVNALSESECTEMATYCESAHKREYLACTLDLDSDDMEAPKGWSRTKKFLERPDLNEKLQEIVCSGMDQVLITETPSGVKTLKLAGKNRDDSAPWFPRNFIDVPYVSFNRLKLLDKKEIAEHYNLGKIIGKYLDTKTWSTPLSIAVFGKPGSGKSFAVQQVLSSVDPMRRSEPLTFNLAQFSSVDQLTDAFHQIQDRALSTNEVPLAIFDEFDSRCGESPLGWLKYFLAPMQDGLFRGKSGDYRVGRAIFLFSGGTKDSYEAFSAALAVPEPGSPKRSKDEEESVRTSKLEDFISRLRGYIDVLDINDDKGGQERDLMKLRRAVKLRALLELHAKPIMVTYSDGVEHARIDRRVIDAFLTRSYLHGVRSMEAIIQMSRWIDGRFVPASLPSEDQMKIHVEKGKFL